MEALFRHYFLNDEKLKATTEIISPTNPFERGSHLAFKFSDRVDFVCEGLAKRGIIVR